MYHTKLSKIATKIITRFCKYKKCKRNCKIQTFFISILWYFQYKISPLKNEFFRIICIIITRYYLQVKLKLLLKLNNVKVNNVKQCNVKLNNVNLSNVKTKCKSELLYNNLLYKTVQLVSTVVKTELDNNNYRNLCIEKLILM